MAKDTKQTKKRPVREVHCNKLLSGIAAYNRQQTILLRVLRKHKELSQDKFDEIFGDTKTIVKPDGYKICSRRRPRFGFQSFFSGDTYFLGSINQMGDWAKWLGLLQCMMALDMIDTKRIKGKIHYFISGNKNVAR